MKGEFLVELLLNNTGYLSTDTLCSLLAVSRTRLKTSHKAFPMPKRYRTSHRCVPRTPARTLVRFVIIDTNTKSSCSTKTGPCSLSTISRVLLEMPPALDAPFGGSRRASLFVNDLGLREVPLAPHAPVLLTTAGLPRRTRFAARTTPIHIGSPLATASPHIRPRGTTYARVVERFVTSVISIE